MSGYQIYAQAHCQTCRIPVGFRGQQAAYAGSDGEWYCRAHIDRQTRIRADEAQRRARYLKRP